MTYKIRQLNSSEYEILRVFLYESIFTAPGEKRPDQSIIEDDHLEIYYENFGQKDDNALVAEVDGEIVGCVWTRIMDDYGSVGEVTPSLSISILDPYRGQGIGYALMKSILHILKQKGYQQVSLSVQKENYAHKLYSKLGFTVYIEKETEYIMIKELQD